MASDAIAAINKRQVRQAFDRAAETYDQYAVLQYDIAERVLERLDVIRVDVRTVLDIGCGTGYCTRALANRYPGANVIGLDLSPAMVAAAHKQRGWRRRSRYLSGDAEALPIADQSVDLLFSNLAIQWCDPERVFAEFTRVLRPGGVLMFTTFGPDTLKELREAWRQVNDAPHVHTFIDMHDLGDALMRAGLSEPVMDVETLVVQYPDVAGVMRDLKGIGAYNMDPDRTRGLTGKQSYREFHSAYEAMAVEGKIPATYEAVFGHAWAPATPGRKVGGDQVVPVSAIRGRSR
ncbi:MAG: malonyl-ACP O-methyltransferase BioC [Acidiferrobacterales bacterium]|jgi:malonyl-CoA O-methyltransferase|nr:malonyl-ACP O-methyltransferase BioC [Acidiferrobacterales bacterium]